MVLTSKETSKALSKLNDKLLEILNDRGVIASYLFSPLSKITNPDHTSHFKLVKDPQSIPFNDLLRNKTIPITLFKNLLSLPDTDKKFKF